MLNCTACLYLRRVVHLLQSSSMIKTHGLSFGINNKKIHWKHSSALIWFTFLAAYYTSLLYMENQARKLI